MSVRSLLLGVLALASLGVGVLWLLRGDRESPRPPPAQPAIELPREPEEAPALALSQTEPRTPAQIVDAPPTWVPTDEDLVGANWVEGRVVVPPGLPQGEWVTLEARGKAFPSGVRHRVLIQGDGSFLLAFPKGANSGTLKLENRFLLLQDRKVSLPCTEGALELQPELCGVLKGRIALAPIAEPRRKELAGTQVRLWSKNWSNSPARKGLRPEARLDERAEFEFVGVPGATDWELTLPAGAFDDAKRVSIAVQPGHVTQVDLCIALRAVVRGVVVDETGMPLASAEFEHVLHDVEKPQSARLKPKSGRDGAFEISGIPLGRGSLVTKLTNYLTCTMQLGELTEGQLVDGLRVVLERGKAIGGHVCWPDRRPVIGAQVSAMFVETQVLGEAKRSVVRTPSSKTDQTGTFRIYGIPESALRVIATAADPEAPEAARWNAFLELDDPPPRELELVLARPCRIRGWVRDGAGNSPGRFSVHARPLWRLNLSDSYATFSSPEDSMSPDGSFVLGGLFSMTYELTAAVSSFEEPHKVRVELPGTGEPVEILVTTRCAVSGSVVDPYGRAVGGAEVRAKGWDGPPGVESGADGRFRIEGVKPETHNLVAKARGWAPSEPTQIGMSASGSPEDVVLRLRPPGRIAGEVLAADGKPEADRPLRLERAGLQLDARSDSQGRFLFDELAPGDYSVFTRATELELARLPSRAKAESRNCSDPIPRGASIKLGEGEVANVTLKPDPPLANPIRVDGKVRCAGRPVEGCEISAFRLSPGSFAKSPEATSGADGRFQFRVDGPGPYSFSISPPRDAPTTKVRVEIESRGAVELVLEVPAGGIRGVTVDAEGRRVGDISLELEPEDASGGAIGSRGWLRSDGQGRFEFAHVAPGQYLITGESHDDALVHHGKTSRGGFIVSEGVALDEVKFVMLAGCRVEGTVRRPDGQPAAVALIRVREESGSQWLNQAAADSNGQYVLQGLPPGRYSIQAQTDRLASQETEPLSLGASAPSKIDLVLQEATDLDVVSLDAEGKVCFLMLELLDSRGRRSLSGRWLTRDSDARPTARRIGPLAPGTYTLRAMWPDGRALEQEVKLTGERTLELTLRPPN